MVSGGTAFPFLVGPRLGPRHMSARLSRTPLPSTILDSLNTCLHRPTNTQSTIYAHLKIAGQHRQTLYDPIMFVHPSLVNSLILLLSSPSYVLSNNSITITTLVVIESGNSFTNASTNRSSPFALTASTPMHLPASTNPSLE